MGGSPDLTLNQKAYAPEAGSSIESVDEQTRGVRGDERIASDVKRHSHDGQNSERIHLRSIEGLIRTVTQAPTHIPRNFSEQFVIYKSGATKRLYWYDTLNNEWDFVVGT